MWVTRWRTVACDAGARSFGVSPSKPSSTWISANSGRYLATGSSRSRLPCSTSWSAAVVVTIFVIDAIRSIVSAVMGSSDSTERTPAAPS